MLIMFTLLYHPHHSHFSENEGILHQ